MCSIPYINAVGALAYLAIATRPDIAHSVGVLARFSQNSGLQHWKAVKYLFRYLKDSLDYKLTYSPTSSSSTELFHTCTDADHGGNPDNGHSTSGYVVKMGTGAISWQSCLQSLKGSADGTMKCLMEREQKVGRKMNKNEEAKSGGLFGKRGSTEWVDRTDVNKTTVVPQLQ